MTNFKIFLISVFIAFTYFNDTFSQIIIKYKVGDKIVTNADIEFEKNYLIFLKPGLDELSNEEMKLIAEKSIIRDTIKKKEIDKVFKDLNNLEIINGVKKSLFRFKNVQNEDEFLKLIKNKNLNYEKIVEKMKYEGMWNELIFQKYNTFVVINKEKLKSELLSKILKDKKYEYNLSEILFEIDGKSSRENKFKEIIAYINNNSFKTAASKFSVSNSSNKGGEIGWVKETVLSDELNKILKKMQINEISKPIRHPNGFLLIKINNKRELKQNLNFDEELKDLINFEKSKQLNQYSLMHYKKLKQNSKINEY